MHALLRHHGVTRSVTVPVSAGLLADVDGYFRALTAYRAGDPGPVVSASVAGTLAALGNASALVEDLLGIRAGWQDVVRARADAAAWRWPTCWCASPCWTRPRSPASSGGRH